jgi:hypothetical protein
VQLIMALVAAAVRVLLVVGEQYLILVLVALV